MSAGLQVDRPGARAPSKSRRPAWAEIARFGRVLLALYLGLVSISCRRDLDSQLLHALRERNESRVELLLSRGAKPNARTRDGQPALLLAAKSRRPGLVRLLLRAGAPVDEADPQGATPLMIAAFLANDSMVRMLFDAGADANARNEGNGTALGMAAYFGDSAFIQLFLDHGASAGEDKSVALLVAAFSGNLPAAKLLLASGASPNGWVNREGRTALQVAIDARHAEIVRLLLQYGANLRVVDPEFGTTALSMAVGEPEIMEALLAAGAEVDGTNANGSTALLMAVLTKEVADVELLLRYGADPNRRDKNGTTPLMHALLIPESADAAIVRTLLRGGADPNMKDAGGRTVWDWIGTAGISTVLREEMQRRHQ
jgi:ankyrin repeat protein